VLAASAIDERPAGGIVYGLGAGSAREELAFYQSSARYRLEHSFNRVYRYMEAFFERGQSPYVRFIRKNCIPERADPLERVEKLRRHPPCVIPDPEGETRASSSSRPAQSAAGRRRSPGDAAGAAASLTR